MGLWPDWATMTDEESAAFMASVDAEIARRAAT
jgi:hypothetical protein